jgi:uncharacterized membrane protein YfcA
MSIGLAFTLIAVGFVAGTYGTVVGVGGGFILSPVFMLFYHLPPRQAVGTALVLVWLNSLVGFLAYARKRPADYRVGGLMAITGAFASILAAPAVALLSDRMFKAILGGLLLAASIVVALRPEPARSETLCGTSVLVDQRRVALSRQGTNTVLGYGFLCGFLASFFGTGGGWLRMPILVHRLKMPVSIAVPTSLFALSVYTLIGAGAHVWLGNTFVPYSIAAGAGIIPGAVVGAAVSNRIDGRRVLQLLAVLIGLMAAQLIVVAARGP